MGSNEKGFCAKKKDICGGNEQHNSTALLKKICTYAL